MADEIDPAKVAGEEAATIASPAPNPENVKAAEKEVAADKANAKNCEDCNKIYYDAVIPIVYPMQPILVPYASIKEALGGVGDFFVDEVESVKRTFTKPEAKPPLAIVKQPAGGVKVTGLGHAGVAIINGRTGEVKYYEYGRYDSTPDGKAREVGVVNVQIGSDNNPTRSSFDVLASELTRTNGGPYSFEAAYIKLPEGAFAKMDAFAKRRIAETLANSADDYNVSGNHCFTFAMEVAKAGGANSSVAGAEELEVTVVVLGGYETSVDRNIDLPSRQIQMVQAREQTLSVNEKGAITGSFSFQ